MRIATFFACIHIPAIAVEPGELCPSSDPALQRRDPKDTRSRILALSSISTS